MKLCSCRVFVVVLFVMVFVMMVEVDLVEGGKEGGVRNYISWEDLMVDEERLVLKNGNFKNNKDVRVIVVDQNGNGHSKTVQGAVDLVPDWNIYRVKIYIFPGIYRERVFVPKTKPYISFIGRRNLTSSPVITWNSKSSDKGPDGQALGTYGSATVAVESDFFCATEVTFENTVVTSAGGKGMQAVALRVDSDKAMFYRVKIKGTQDTLLDNTGTHYFYRCLIQGKVDFIFGNAKSLYEKCRLHSIAENYGAIAAHHRDSPLEDTGFSFVGCNIRGTGSVYLGRAWGDYSRIIYSNCNMDDIINPLGWSEWDHPQRKKTAVFGEYKCHERPSNVVIHNSYASSGITNGPYYGVSGATSVYNPNVTDAQSSGGYLFVQNGLDDKISVGWHVSPRLYNDHQTYIYTQWTSNNNNMKAGCYNLLCNGFVQTDTSYYPGASIANISIRGQDIYELPLSLTLDQKTNNWWLSVVSLNIGYFPGALFSNLDKAGQVGWGGSTETPIGVCPPPMGSGEFPSNNFLYGAFFRHVSIKDINDDFGPGKNIIGKFNDADCYGIEYYGDQGGDVGFSLQFGGFGGC